ncbi:MAG TPA: diacylglycerol kinase family protein [Opitutaceae bacterium]|nr:diacylglycerol kinase family protein [Opitutaceae bacterium]
MKTRFIFNPHSGRNRRNPWLIPAIHEFIERHGLDADLVSTLEPGHATQLAREAVALGCERVVAVGGDGTMNEVAQALIASPAALALVPCGSGNGLALHLGIPTSPRQALALLAEPSSRIAAIDTGSANGHPFCNAMGFGFDAEISRRFNRLTRRGLPAYAMTGYAAFRGHRPEHCVILGAGRREELAVFVVAIANSDQYGNHALIAPGARVDDGLLDLVAVRPVGFAGAVPLVARLFLGTLDRSARVLRLRDHRFSIIRSAPGFIHTDGETHATDARIEVLVRPRSLRLVVPAASRARPAAETHAEPHGAAATATAPAREPACLASHPLLPSGECHVLRDIPPGIQPA